MWFRPGSQSSLDSDRFGVAGLKKRIRNARKSPSKSLSLETTGSDSIASSNDDVNEKSGKNAARARVSTDPPTRKLVGKTLSNSNEKEKALDDRKFKNNKIMKSTSKTKIPDLEKRDHNKSRSFGSSRKISAPPILDTGKIMSNCSTAVKKNLAGHSNLNLNALYKLVGSNRKLSREEFERLRKKSLTEAGVAGKITTLDSETLPPPSPVDKIDPKNNDELRNGSTEPAKEDEEHVHDENIKHDNNNVNGILNNDDDVDKATSNEECDINSNNDTSQTDVKELNECQETVAESNSQSKKMSPSLTSRVAAKISETTNNYKNRRAKPLKKRKSSRKIELYKQISIDRPHSASVVRQPSDRKPEISSTTTSSNSGAAPGQSEWASQSIDSESNSLDVEPESKKERSKSKSAPVSVNRSESYKERLSQKRNRNNRRKTSDPSLTKTNDEQDAGLSNHATCSSSSLSSASLESPSTSLEQVAGPTATTITNAGPLTTATTTTVTAKQWVESEEEEPDLLETDWSSNVAAEILAMLSDAEKKRQEIINEIYQTERSHVRTLKLLDRIFMRPLSECGVLPQDHILSLFPPGLLSLKDIHSAFECKLKQRRTEHVHVVRTLGDLLTEMFEGKCGEELREHAAQVCARQQIALEALKEKRRKDENLHRFLVKAESHKSCRRLQLKDLLPTVLQRLTKYPLLFENLVNVTKRVDPDNNAELDAIQRALDSSKRILVYVNQAVKAAEDAHKLQTIQRKLDKSNIDKDLNELRNLDLTQYKLIHDGLLQMKKTPGIQLHGLLFENMMVLLQKLDDKYLLRSFPHTTAGGGEGFISPITHFDQQTLVRQSAVDKNTFFLIITKTSQMLELKAPSSSECKTWFKHISDAAEQYKPRSKSIHDVIEDPASATLPHSNTKESLESTTDRLSTDTATAASTTDLTSIARQSIEEHPTPAGTNNDQIEPGTSQQLLTESTHSIKDSQRDSLKVINERPASSSKDDSNVLERSISKEQDIKKRNSSTLLSNNSNDTRTLTQQCVLLDPSEIRISISPAHTAEPVLTNSERLRRLDDKIKADLQEKERIICDMFRVPQEHFAAIVDIASQPEAPKDTSDIALAAFAHVQTLTEIVAQYMKVTPEQEISAVSTPVCDVCYYRGRRSVSPRPPLAAVEMGAPIVPVIRNLVSPPQAGCDVVDDKILQEDDGYCQIDELRLPSITNAMSQPIPVASSKELSSAETSSVASSIAPVEEKVMEPNVQSCGDSNAGSESEENTPNANDEAGSANKESGSVDALVKSIHTTENDEPINSAPDDPTSNEDKQHGDTNDTTTSTTKCLVEKSNVESVKGQFVVSSSPVPQCEINRLVHALSIGPSVPCHVISGIVTALSSQISLLLPKINERDIERERLRRENHRLRELLHAMHARQRVEEEKETPENTNSAENPPN